MLWFMRRSISRLAPLVCALLLAGTACNKQRVGSQEAVSDDDAVQLKFEAAQRVLSDLKLLRQRGSAVDADCTSAKMLFLKDLKKIEAPAAKRLVKELIEICEVTRPE